MMIENHHLPSFTIIIHNHLLQIDQHIPSFLEDLCYTAHHNRGGRGRFGGRDIRRGAQRSSRNFGRGGGGNGGGRGNGSGNGNGGSRGVRRENSGGYYTPEARDAWN